MAEEDDDLRPLVLDNGSGTCKVGIAGEDEPRFVFSSVIGRPRYHVCMAGVDGYRDWYPAEQAEERTKFLKVASPMTRGVITNTDDMYRIFWHAFFTCLKVAPEEQPLVITEAPHNPPSNRQAMAEILFESFDVPVLYVAMPTLLSMIAHESLTEGTGVLGAHGVTQGTGHVVTHAQGTGVVVDIGHGVTHIMPFHQGRMTYPTGRPLSHAIHRVDLAGVDVDQYLAKFLIGRGHDFIQTDAWHMVRKIKEQLCSVTLDQEKIAESTCLASSANDVYELPDGATVTLGNDRFRAAEGLFHPSIFGIDTDGIHKQVHNVILKCDAALQKLLYGNIILTGGSTLFHGFPERMQKELDQLTDDHVTVRMRADPWRQRSAWRGGSILASSPQFEGMCITREDYEEKGPSILYEKFS